MPLSHCDTWIVDRQWAYSVQRVPDCLGGLSRVGISTRSTRPWNGQPPSIYKDHNTLNERTREHVWKICHERSRLNLRKLSKQSGKHVEFSPRTCCECTYFQFNSIVYFRHTFGPYHIIICHNTIEKYKSNI